MMSLMAALLETYDFALDNGLVDNPKLSSSGLTLLPVYHSNKKVSSNEDVFEITIDKNSNAIGGRFLDKEEVVVFPITEDSIIRSGSKIAPHAISDELSYLAKKIDVKKNKEYLKGIKELLDYEKGHSCENFRIIGEYVIKNTLLDDFLKLYLGNTEYSIDGFKLSYEEIGKNDKINKKTIDLRKIFITFKLEKEFSGDITLTRDVGLHDFYIGYVRDKNLYSKELSYCDITGKLDYCIERHRGIIGNAKLISISNHDETYYGRLKNGKDIYHISYEVSQKVHNMLKYLIDNHNHSSFIGENAYIINWLSQDLEKGGIELLSGVENENEEFDDEDFEAEEEKSMAILGGGVSYSLGKYFLGQGKNFGRKGDFYILIIEKISNGRVSMKYFRKLSRSEAYQRVVNWYNSTSWKFYNSNLQKFTKQSPSLYQVASFVYGQESSKGYLACENKKLSRSTIERLIPCIIDSQKLPKDILKTTFYKLSNKQSYKNSWNIALNIGCSLIKKYKNDYENCTINADNISEVKQLEESRSFYYGELMAIYEKIELDAIRGRELNMDSKREKGKIQRITNADRLWSSMIRTPERTRFILESKIKPYMNILKRNNPGWYTFYDKLITEITLELIRLKESDNMMNGSLNEDFILGYYYRKNMFYQRKAKDTKKESININSVEQKEED